MKARLLHGLAVASLIGLVALGIAVELWLAPLRPHGSWLVMKVVPLVLALPGTIRARVYTLQWSSMLILLYFAEGLISATTARGPAVIWALIEIALALVYFVCVLAYLYPIKREARARRAAAFPPE